MNEPGQAAEARTLAAAAEAGETPAQGLELAAEVA